MDHVHIDGAQGEGGGQVLRTALSLSLITGRPFRMEHIRARRRKPGLLRQHLTAVQAAQAIGRATVTGAELGSSALTFEPGRVEPGEYRLAVGTAGSSTLVFQTVLLPLLLSKGPSELVLEGGTHNPIAPPFDFIARTFLPVLQRMGAVVDVRLERHGFYPAGGGKFTAHIEPCRALLPLALLDRGETKIGARALISSLAESIAKRELTVVRERLRLDRDACIVVPVGNPIGPGNVLMIQIESAGMCEVITGFGQRGVSAEDVAARACDDAEAYLAAGVPVGAHLADQLLLPLALAGEGRFRTLAPTAHTTTNADVIRQFLDVSIAINEDPAGGTLIRVGQDR